MADIKPMLVIVIAVVILVFPGMIFNNLTTSGLAPAQVLTCPGAPDVTCQGSINAGCQAAAAQCGLSGVSVSFLNQASPFTALIQGNIFGFFNGFTQIGAITNHGPFDLSGGGPYVKANCVDTLVAGNNLKSLGFTGQCTQSTADNANMTVRQANNLTNWNTILQGTTQKIHFRQIANASISVTCNTLGQVNYTFPGGSNGYTYYGCDYYTPAGGFTPSTAATTKAIWGILYAVPYGITGCTTQGNACHLGFTGGYACVLGAGTCFHLNIFAQSENYDTFECFSAIFTHTLYNYFSSQCQAFYDGFQTSGNAPIGGGNSINFGFLTPVLAFIAGIVLFLIGLGITFTLGGTILGTGTTFGAGTNTQGTRLAQTLGLGLIIWAPLYSQFSTWFTSGNLPYGFDGATGLISLFLTGLFFVGVFWQMLAGGTTG